MIARNYPTSSPRDSNMPFVNDFISSEDVRKYGLEEIDTHYVVGGTRSRQWTIDRSRDLYLRIVERGGGGGTGDTQQDKLDVLLGWRGTHFAARSFGGSRRAWRAGLVALEAGLARWQS